MSGGNGSRDDRELHRLIEDGFGAVPKTVRSHYDRHDLVNDIYILFKSRGVSRPKKIQIRLASIDIHRRNTHYPRTWRERKNQKPHPIVLLEPKLGTGDNEGDGVGTATSASSRAEIAESLKDIRRRFGTDGLAVFLMTRVMSMDSRTACWIMDFEPDSALGKSLSSIGGG